MLDEERCYRAVLSRDRRFDGWFTTAVATTGIYCRPSCPARSPKRANVRFFASAAAAQGAGYRACKRCHPDAAPGSPEWNIRSDVVGRAMRLIAEGTVEVSGVAGLARAIGYSQRQLNRLLHAEVGAGALALARAQRAHTARVLLETTGLAATEVAFAAGFASVRQFNDTVREVFGVTPTALRSRAGRSGLVSSPGTIRLRLAYREPFAAEAIFAFLARRAVAGVEAGDSRSFRRTLSLPRGAGAVWLEAGEAHVQVTLRLDDLRDLACAVARCRRLLDLDADPQAVDDQLGGDPVLADLVVERPGLRSPGCVDGDELAMRAVLGQQVSVAAARTAAARLSERYGEVVDPAVDGLTRRFPAPAVVAEVDPSTLALPRARADALVGLARALAEGEVALDAGADWTRCESGLLGQHGIGAWTAGYVAARALGHPDVFLPGDAGVRRALRHLGHPDGAAAASQSARAWRPWRTYALHHLWASLGPSTQERTP